MTSNKRKCLAAGIGRTIILLLWAPIVMFVFLFAAAGLYGIDSGENRGYTFGYYGQFNRLQNALEDIPGVEVTRAGANHDISLEEIAIYVSVSGAREVGLFFGEDEPIRSLSGVELTNALRERLDVESPAWDQPS